MRHSNPSPLNSNDSIDNQQPYTSHPYFNSYQVHLTRNMQTALVEMHGSDAAKIKSLENELAIIREQLAEKDELIKTCNQTINMQHRHMIFQAQLAFENQVVIKQSEDKFFQSQTYLEASTRLNQQKETTIHQLNIELGTLKNTISSLEIQIKQLNIQNRQLQEERDQLQSDNDWTKADNLDAWIKADDTKTKKLENPNKIASQLRLGFIEGTQNNQHSMPQNESCSVNVVNPKF